MGLKLSILSFLNREKSEILIESVKVGERMGYVEGRKKTKKQKQNKRERERELHLKQKKRRKAFYQLKENKREKRKPNFLFFFFSLFFFNFFFPKCFIGERRNFYKPTKLIIVLDW